MHMPKPAICIIGAGYVGLPLAVAFSKHFQTVVYTHSQTHVQELKHGIDRTENFSAEELLACDMIITSDLDAIRFADVYIVTVPTPVNEKMQPDLSAVTSATHAVGSVLSKGDIVVYESTVYIGCTEELCMPILQEESGLIYNEEFFCGFSPERINPADREHTIKTVVKIVSGSSPDITQRLASLYGTIVEAGIHKAPSIKVAEASKLLENIQRDVNIALMNELSVLYREMGIVTSDVIDAASTKWNFNVYTPGLVGGHCIGVDPYYLIYNAHEKGLKIPIIEQARSTNNTMAEQIVEAIESLMEQKNRKLNGRSALLLGVTFKENCSDIRNSQSARIYNLLDSKGAEIDVVDPCAHVAEVREAYGIGLIQALPKGKVYDVIIVAVAHDDFKMFDWKKLKSPDAVLFDVKGIVPKDERDLYL